MITPHTGNFLNPASIGTNLALRVRLRVGMLQMDQKGEFQEDATKNKVQTLRSCYSDVPTLLQKKEDCCPKVEGSCCVAKEEVSRCNSGLKRKAEDSCEAANNIAKVLCERKHRKKTSDLIDQIKALAMPFVKEKAMGPRVTLIEVLKSAIMHIRFHEDQSSSQKPICKLCKTICRLCCENLSLPTASELHSLFPNSKEFSRVQRIRRMKNYREQRRRSVQKMLLAKLENVCVPLPLRQCIKRHRVLEYVLSKLKSLPCENCTAKCGFRNVENETKVPLLEYPSLDSLGGEEGMTRARLKR